MSETKWASGPWEVSDCLYRGISHKYREISSRTETFWIAQVLSFDSTETTPEPEAYRANARLIAAAPEEDAALICCVKTLENLFNEGISPHQSEIAAAIRMGRAALAKARGESA